MGFFDRFKQRPHKEVQVPQPKITLELNRPRAFHTKLAGTSNYKDALKGCKPGERLWLQREPNNPYDANAISVWSSSKKLVGYIKKDLAADLAPQMDRGNWIEATIKSITGGTEDKPNIGCNIFLEFTQVTDI